MRPLLCGECGNGTCASAISCVLTRHVYLCTQHTDVGTVWCGHWTVREGRNFDQVDVMMYNQPNSTECADAGSRAIINQVRDVRQPKTYAPVRSMLGTLLSNAVQFESGGTCAGLSL